MKKKFTKMPMSLGAKTRFLTQIAQTLWLVSCHFCGLAFQVGCFLKHMACELGHMSPHAHPFLSSRGILLLPSFTLLTEMGSLFLSCSSSLPPHSGDAGVFHLSV